MDYMRTKTDGQLALTQTTEWLHFPSALHGFHNTATRKKRAESGRNVFCFHGLLDIPEEERTCRCGARMHINGHPTITLRHLCIGGHLSCLMFPHNQLKCPACGATKTQSIPFKALGYRITEELYQYTRDLLAFGTYTNEYSATRAPAIRNIAPSVRNTAPPRNFDINPPMTPPVRAIAPPLS